jgi:hypothetical protein
MRRICGYIISILAVILSSTSQVKCQDTLLIPLKIKFGVDVLGPATYFADKNIFSAEGYFAVDLNEKLAAAVNAGYLNYKYSQYNYFFESKGVFMRMGADFNLLKPKKSQGKYWGGVGVRYGISLFNYEVPSFRQSNYWGEATSSIASRTSWGHFLEASPGMRAELFPNFTMGWSVSLRMMLYVGKEKNLPPVYFPGFGNGAKRFSSGFSYFFVWNIPYKKIRVIIQKEEPEEEEDEDMIQQNQDSRTTSPGASQQSQKNSLR